MAYQQSNSNSGYKTTNQQRSNGQNGNSRKLPSSAITETTANTSNHDYQRNSKAHHAQIMGMTGGFNQTGVQGQHLRYQSQLSQQTKNDIQQRMNMTITHGYTSGNHHSIQSGVGSHGPP